MTQLFFAFTQADVAVATELRSSLETDGYLIWRNPQAHDLQSLSSRRSIERGILGSAAVVLVWSDKAGQDEWVERQLLFAQRMRKLIFPLLLDTTAFTNLFAQVVLTPWQGSAMETTVTLLTLPNFPEAQSTDPFGQLCEQAAHEHLRVRKEAVAQASVVLKQSQHREEVLALLEYLAEHDLMMGVREKAEEILRADAAAHLMNAQTPREIFLSNAPLVVSETTITLDIVSEEETLRGGERVRTYEGKITLNPQSVRIYSIPSQTKSGEPLLRAVNNAVSDAYLIIIPFSLHEAPGKNYYEKVKFSVDLTTPGAIAFDLFPKNISAQINGPTCYTVSSHLRIEEVRTSSNQGEAPISFTTLYPQITSFGEGEREFYWLYRGTRQQKEVPPETKHVLIVLRVPRGTQVVDGTIRWEIVVSRYLQDRWRSIDCKEDSSPLHWELGEVVSSFQEKRSQEGLNLFYAYASEDEKLQEKLEKHLSMLRRWGWIQEWRAYDVKAGQPRAQVNDFLTRSRIILLLISADFLASDELYEQQLELALKMQKEGRACVLPILLRSVDWQETPFGQLLVLPRNQKPIVEWPDQDVAFAEIAREIRAVIERQ